MAVVGIVAHTSRTRDASVSEAQHPGLLSDSHNTSITMNQSVGDQERIAPYFLDLVIGKVIRIAFSNDFPHEVSV